MHAKKGSNFLKFLLVLGIFSLFIAGLFYFFAGERGPIYDFKYERDAKPILKIFDKDWYWLVASSREDYSADFMLKNKVPPGGGPEKFGELVIKVLLEDGKLAGFVAYHKKKFYEGFLLFLAVDKAFRGKGYGEQLARYAIDDLFEQGCSVIRLVTRTNNTAARKLYKKLGFDEALIEDGFVYFQVFKNDYYKRLELLRQAPSYAKATEDKQDEREVPAPT